MFNEVHDRRKIDTTSHRNNSCNYFVFLLFSVSHLKTIATDGKIAFREKTTLSVTVKSTLSTTSLSTQAEHYLPPELTFTETATVLSQNWLARPIVPSLTSNVLEEVTVSRYSCCVTVCSIVLHTRMRRSVRTFHVPICTSASILRCVF